MARRFLGVVAGVAVWMVIVTIVGVIMRGAWREYAAVADAMTFTLPMMLARLTIGALATIAAGWVTAVDREAIDIRDIGMWCASARRLHSAAHHALEQVSRLVSPDVSDLTRSADLAGRNDR